MNIDAQAVGKQIAYLRKSKGLTQSELGERLNISFQAVSNWERGETLPDVNLLVDLSHILETSVDYILTGGQPALNYRGKITVADMRRGITCIGQLGTLLGRDNLIYRSAIQGINEAMNTDIEVAFADDYLFECFVAEAIIQNLKAGAYIDLTDVKNSFHYDHFRDIVSTYAAEHGIR